MTLVKSLYSGDPDVIRNTRTCEVPDVHSGLQHLQGLFGLLPSLSPYAWHMHWGAHVEVRMSSLMTAK